MTLWSEPDPCIHGRVDGCPFCLARSTDPATSAAAAASIDHQLKPHHLAVLDWLADYGPATDDQIAAAMVRLGETNRQETARRWVRTLRETHRLIVPALDDSDGHHVLLLNESGRWAYAWTVQ